MDTEARRFELDIRTARQMLEEAVPRLVQRVNRGILLVAGFACAVELISLMRLAAEFGLGQGVLSIPRTNSSIGL